jgi:membrane protease YdiL (CAAX protease family)
MESTSTAPPNVPAGQSAPPDTPARPPWPALTGVLGLIFGILLTVVLIMLVGGIYVAVGFDDPSDAASFDFVAIAVQSLALVGVALVLTSRMLRPTPFQFGFRRPKISVVGPTLIAFFGYLAVAYVYALIANPAKDDLPQELGADQSTSLAIITGIFVIGVAPFVEEFFFRGFLYQSFRNEIGVWPAAIVSGVIFGGIHFKPEYFVPLSALGILLAWLFEKTGSLWPCIAVHAINNTLAFAVLL